MLPACQPTTLAVGGRLDLRSPRLCPPNVIVTWAPFPDDVAAACFFEPTS